MKLPYEQIPEAPDDYTSGNVIARFIDGLGYRYYWATEGLTEKDLQFSPSEEARTTLQTIEHVYGLSIGILNAPQNLPNIRTTDTLNLSFDELRKQTLLNLKKASALFSGKSAEEVSKYKVIFQSKEKTREFPYWNMINGQISDAIYHVGQIVSFRRSSGNAMNSKVSVFLGKTGN
ncbi:hypothetical protein [Aquimarina mytili]|nr:hypothetical protein [Aquimarina mytili]